MQRFLGQQCPGFFIERAFSCKETVELRSWKTVRFSEQVMSADKYLSIFSHQMEAIVYIFFKINFVPKW